MEPRPRLPLGKQLTYATGQLGWSILINVVGLELVYFYLPPNGSGLPYFITQVAFLGVLNAITIVAASGRLFDAFIDPLVASLSDRSRHPRGRRIPFMALGALPAAFCLVLIFFPPVRQISAGNIAWLVATQLLFYIAFTTYVTPYFALLPELGHNANERLNLSTWISITYALGIILAAQTPALASLYLGLAGGEKLLSLQYAVVTLAVLALVLMLVPVFTIDEKKYCTAEPSTVPLWEALKKTFSNPHFIFFIVAAFSYFAGLTIINTGLLYYVTVLLRQGEVLVSALLAIMVLVSFVFYPLVNVLAKKTGKKPLVVIAFFWMSLIFFAIYFLGRFTFIPNVVQAYLVVLLYAVPLAFLGVLPNAVLADIAEHDALNSGQRKEGMFFAANTLAQKFGQTFGILLFAGLTVFGKDPGADQGIRLSGMAGFVLCLVAGLVFMRYNEKEVLSQTLKQQAATQERAIPIQA